MKNETTTKTTIEIATEYVHAKRASDIARAYTGPRVFSKALRGILWASAPADATDSVIDAMLPHARDAFRERGLLLDESAEVTYVEETYVEERSYGFRGDEDFARGT